MLTNALVYGALVSGALLVGALAGALLSSSPRLTAVLTVFGGGLLLGAMAFEVVPESSAAAGRPLTAAGLVAGAFVFIVADRLLTNDEGRRDLRRTLHAACAGRMAADQGSGRGAGGMEGARGLSIALGLTIDGIPETAALGVMVAEGEVGIALLVGVVVSNLVESYGAAQPIVDGGRTTRFALTLFAGVALVLLAAMVVGSTLLSAAGDSVVGFGEALAGGAIFATVLIAVVPHAFAEVSRLAAAAATLGLVAAFALS